MNFRSTANAPKIMPSEKTPAELAQLDHETALNAVAGHAKGNGYEIAGGDKNINAPYSLVLQNAHGYVAVKVTAVRAPNQPGYSPSDVAQLKQFAAQHGIRVCAIAPVGLMPAGMNEQGQEGFYIKYDGLVTV
jgi:hypothetical protein